VKLQDVDLDARNARITGKYGKTRVVLLTQGAADASRNYIADRKIYVFQQDFVQGNVTLDESKFQKQLVVSN
jgi:integrase